MKSSKKIKEFKEDGILIKSKENTFSHVVTKIKKVPSLDEKNKDKEKYKYTWFSKAESDDKVAQQEVIAQEFFRFLIPNHPKTRLATDESKSDMYVLSKEVPGFIGFLMVGSAKLNKNIKDGTFFGLGDIAVIALLLNEIDLQAKNLGVNNQGQIIKIDGDWCFARLRGRCENVTTTPEIIDGLPFRHCYFSNSWYYANNWLDEVGMPFSGKTIVFDADIGLLPHIRGEINRALLRAITMPEALVKHFIESYISDEKRIILLTKEVNNRNKQLRKAALANKSFQDCLNTNSADKELKNHIEYLKNFKTTEKNYLIQKFPDAEKHIRENFKMMRSKIGFFSNRFVPRQKTIYTHKEYIKMEGSQNRLEVSEEPRKKRRRS